MDSMLSTKDGGNGAYRFGRSKPSTHEAVISCQIYGVEANGT